VAPDWSLCPRAVIPRPSSGSHRPVGT